MNDKQNVRADELKAGPELDARIATEVMGWYVLPLEYTNDMPCWSNKPSAEKITDKSDWLRPVFSWKPSTDIADAWRVLRSFEQDCAWGCGIALDTQGNSDGYYAAISLKGERKSLASYQFAATQPLAICRAALLWHAMQAAILETYGQPAEVRDARLSAVRQEFFSDQPTEVVRA